MGEYRGRRALVTGAGRNIGRAIALAFAEAGSDVGIIVHRNREEAEAVRAEIEAFGVKAAVAYGNVGDAAECERMVGEISGAIGPIDYLVNNVGYRPHQSFMEISVEQWNAILGSNLSSVFYLSRLVLPGMAERGFGRIVNIGGPDGLHGSLNRAHNVTCKAGMVGLTKAIGLEFGPQGVTANLVIPGAMETSRVEKDYPAYKALVASLGELRQRSEIAIPRQGTLEELADAVMFFCSRKAGYMTGQSLYVTGGLWGLG